MSEQLENSVTETLDVETEKVEFRRGELEAERETIDERRAAIEAELAELEQTAKKVRVIREAMNGGSPRKPKPPAKPKPGRPPRARRSAKRQPARARSGGGV